MYDYLKALFGTNEDGTPVALTFDQLAEKLDQTKEVKLANLAEGGYVSKEKFEAKELEANGLKTQLSDANATIQSYKDMDIEGIKQSAKDWEQKYNDDTKKLNDQLTANERNYREDLFFKDYRFTSKAAENGVRAEFDSKNFTLDNGVFLGGKEFMDKLRADDDYKAAFVSDEPAPEPEPQPTKPKPQFSDPAPQQTPPKSKLGLREMMIRKNENPNAEIKFD